MEASRKKKKKEDPFGDGVMRRLPWAGESGKDEAAAAAPTSDPLRSRRSRKLNPLSRPPTPTPSPRPTRIRSRRRKRRRARKTLR
ncbi:MAG: hypothetical protein WKG07_01645 [Hymenobacter sp.]